MHRPAPAWNLSLFTECLDQWIDLEKPQQDMILTVASWTLSRYDDPYFGAKRERGFDNLWYLPVPGTADEQGRVVLCSYFIKERERLVTCSSFATLSMPI